MKLIVFLRRLGTQRSSVLNTESEKPLLVAFVDFPAMIESECRVGKRLLQQSICNMSDPEGTAKTYTTFSVATMIK